LDISKIIDDPGALANLLYEKHKDAEEEQDPVEQAKKQVALLKLGRQIREFKPNKKEK